VLNAIDDVSFQQRPIPKALGDHEILVEVKKTGICGSDVHFYKHGRIGPIAVEQPMVLGHESSGVVSQVGAKVTHLKPGDRVALEPGAVCGLCHECKSGKYELCGHIQFAATPPKDGTLGRYYCLPAGVSYLIPDSMTLEDAAMIEPLSVAVHAVANIGNFRATQTIAVWGAGPVGLLCMAVAKALVAVRVIGIDIVPSRLEFAKNYAATDVFLPPSPNENESKMEYSKRCAEVMMKEFGLQGRGGNNVVDVVVDASGAEASIQTALHVVKVGGTLVQLGMGTADVQIPMTLMLIKEVTIKGSFRYGPGDYPFAISLVTQGKVDLKPLVTHRFPFDQAVEAFKATHVGKSDDGKPVIKAIISGPDVSPDDHM